MCPEMLLPARRAGTRFLPQASTNRSEHFARARPPRFVGGGTFLDIRRWAARLVEAHSAIYFAYPVQDGAFVDATAAMAAGRTGKAGVSRRSNLVMLRISPDAPTGLRGMRQKL